MKSICTVRFFSALAGARFRSFSDVCASLALVVVLVGAASAQTVSLSTTSLTFGNQVLGTTSKAKIVTLTNTGTATLTISSIVASGDFAQTNTCGTSVAAGAKCTISVTFTPTATGTRTGSVVITDNAPNSPQTITTTGTGVQPVTLSPASANFPSRRVGTTSTVFPFTLKNNLGVVVSITSVSTTGDFAQTNTCGTSLAVGAKCTISVTFTPTQTGTRTGTLTVSDSASNSPQTASLSGTGTTAGLISIAVTPANPAINIGSTQQFTATGTFNDGSTYNLTKSVVWSSSATSVATISNTAGSQGLATGVAAGITTIKAVSGSISGSTTLTVNGSLVSIAVTPAGASIAVGGQQQYTATGTYSDGSTKNLTSSATWASSATNVATITNAGLATGVAVGTTTISAASGGITGSTTLNVTSAAITSVAVRPATPSAAAGTTQQFKAVATYSDGGTLDITTSVTWSSSATNVATISNSPPTQGLASALAAGSTTITATSGSVSGSTSLTVTSASLSSIVVTPALPAMPIGVPQQFTATGVFSDGTVQNVTASVQWSSSAPTVASVSNSTGMQGLVTSIASGSATITAASGAVTGSTTLAVSSATLVSIAITPANSTAAAGTSQQFSALGTFSDNSTRDLTNAVTWSSSNTGVASISSAGWATCSTAGTTTVSATRGSISGSTSLIVSSASLVSIAITPASASIAAGTTQQFTATGTFSDSTTQNITGSVHWSSSASATGTVSNTAGAQGLATGVAQGTVSVTASLGAVSSKATLTVTNATLSSLAVAPQNPSVPLGASQQFTASGTFSDGTTQDVTALANWTSANPAVAVGTTPSGTVASASAGTSVITASLSGKSGSSTLTVISGLKSIAVTPSSASIFPGMTQQFTATGTYSNGTTQNLTTSATWSSSNASVATISNSAGSQGLATGVAAGTVTITATSGSVSGTATLTVTAPSLVSIAVTPSSASIMVGAKQQFTATGTYSDGSTQNLTTSVTWSSSNTAVATISNASGSQGLATGVATGSSTITATSGSISGTASLTVTPATLVSIAVTPSSASITVGAKQQFTATGTYSDGSTQNLTTAVTWTSSNTAVATISNGSGSQGLATGVATGSSTITATSGSISGTASLTVTPATLVSIAATPSSATVSVGGTQQFAATGTYSDGSTQNLTTSATWSSSNTAVATVSNSSGSQGLATGVAAGTATISAVSAGITGTATLTVSGTPNVWSQDPSPLGPPVRCFITAPSGHVLACAPGVGVFISTDGGSTWSKTAGSGLVDVEVDGLFFSGGTLFAGTHDGVYISTNEGTSWTKSSSGIPLVYGSTATTYNFATFGSTLYAGTQKGVYISQNGGQTWTASGTLPTNNTSVRALAVDASGNIYVGLNDGGDGGAVSNSGSVWISRDGGNTWTWSGFQAWSIRSLYVSGQTVLAGSWRTPYTSGGLEESYDGGTTWSLVLPNYSPNHIEMINGVLYVATRESQLFASSDNGKTFQQIATGSGAQFAIGSAAAGLLLGSDGIYLSTNSGISWSHQNLSSTSQVAQLLYDPSGTIYARSQMFGVSQSTDNGKTWTYINSNSPVYQTRGIHNNYILLNGRGGLLHAIDNSVYLYQSGVWTQSTISPHTFIAGMILLPTGDILVGDDGGCVFRSTDGGSTFGACTHINGGTGGGGVLDFELDSNNVLYTTEETTGAYESTDFGVTWTSLGVVSKGNLYSITPFNGMILVAEAGGSTGVVFRYTGNKTWVRSDTGIGSTTVYQLIVTPSGKVLALGDLEIDVSSDGQNWTKLVTGLPRITNPYYDDVAPMQRPVIGPDGKVHVGISYGGYGTYSAVIQ